MNRKLISVLFITMMMSIQTGLAQSADALMNEFKKEKNVSSVGSSWAELKIIKVLGKKMAQAYSNGTKEDRTENDQNADSLKRVSSRKGAISLSIFFHNYNVSSVKRISLDSCTHDVKGRWCEKAAGYAPNGFSLISRTKKEMVHVKAKDGVAEQFIITNFEPKDCGQMIMKGKFPMKETEDKEIYSLYQKFTAEPDVEYTRLPKFACDMLAVEDTVGCFERLQSSLLLELEHCNESVKQSFREQIESLSLSGFLPLKDAASESKYYQLKAKRRADGTIVELLAFNLTDSPTMMYLVGDIEKKEIAKFIYELLEKD